MGTDPIILILAAGSSSRMRGGDKLLELVEGEPLLRRQARLAVETGCPVVVTLPPDRPLRNAALLGLGVHIVMVPDADLGMAASLRRGLAFVRQMPAASGLMILPGDMPEFTLAALNQTIAAFRADPTRIVRGTAASGQPGHPAIFPADLWDALDQMTGDQGGRQVLKDHPERVQLLALPGNMAITDLDTPEDWAHWRLSRQ